MTTETLQQYFHRVYPDHCQRICENIHEQHPAYAIEWLQEQGFSGLKASPELSYVFSWHQTGEGWEYWARLSRAEGYPSNEAYIREVTALAD